MVNPLVSNAPTSVDSNSSVCTTDENFLFPFDNMEFEADLENLLKNLNEEHFNSLLPEQPSFEINTPLEMPNIEQSIPSPLETLEVKPSISLLKEKKRRIPLSSSTNQSYKKQKITPKEEMNQTKNSFRKLKDEKYQKRLEANKKSAQQSRERKKALKNILEQDVTKLKSENKKLETQITELQTENKVLKREFLHLQNLINDSSLLSKLLAKTNYENFQSVNSKKALPIANDQLTVYMYLIIVLHSFSQHFRNLTPSTRPVSPVLKSLPEVNPVAS